MKNKEKYGVVSFPMKDVNYNVVSGGVTKVHLIVYNENCLKNLTDYQTHLFLDGVFISDDCDDRPMLDKEFKDVSIDELIDDQLANDDYNDFYFPNFNSDDFEQNEIAKYLSIPLVASMSLGKCDMTFEKRDVSSYWNCDFSDLSDKGKVVYKIFEEMYPDDKIRILTFVNNIT